ncbi:MAG: glycoside hydrolase family 38 N-terminal domain-containing protein [Planctomycetota bacterium]
MSNSKREMSKRSGILEIILCLVVLLAIIGPDSAAIEQSQPNRTSDLPAKPQSLRLISAEPTVLFVRQQDGLMQIARITIENTTEPVEASLETKLDGKQRFKNLGLLNKGKTTIEAHIPETGKPAELELVLRTKGKVCSSLKLTWQPQRHWMVYFVPLTHHDLGYTDSIENTLITYDSFYDDVIRFCEQTEDWPEESKYRYTVEGAWSIQHFIENRPEQVTDKLGRYIKQGRIEIGALFGNEISALCSHEGLIRLMYPSFRLKRRFDAQILTGSITDVPGLSWGLPTVLAGAGVKYFFAGLPTYFEWGRNDIHTFWDESAVLRYGRPDAFYWQGPDGKTVLVYYQSSYGFFSRVTGPDSYQEVMDNLPRMLTDMQKNNTPFSVARYIHNGVDNYPPDVKISHIVKEWNSRWAYPKLIVGTNSMFFGELEKQCKDIRTFTGELPHTDYTVGAISTAKLTSINRVTHDRLHSAEKAAAVASLVADYEYPGERIRKAYDCVLLYDEHTWGMANPAGQVQDWSWTDKSLYAYKAAGLTEIILSGSLESITRKIRLEHQGQHIVVFNSLSIDRTDVVRVSRFSAEGSFDLIDEQTNKPVVYQIVKLDSPLAPKAYAAYRYARGQFEPKELFDLVFIAENVPSMGYKTYRIQPTEKSTNYTNSLALSPDSVENQFFKVTLDPITGTISSIFDKELSREIVDKSAPHKLNQFVVRHVQTGEVEVPKQADIKTGQNGPVYASLIVQTQAPGCPQITQEIILYDRVKRIDLVNRVLNDSTPLLENYFAFPFNIDRPEFLFEGTNSVIRPLRDQFPGSNSNYYTVQHWANTSDGQVTVTLSCINSHLLEFGGLWPCYVSQAHHGVTPPGFGADFAKPDQLTKGHMYAFVMDSNFRTNFQPVQQGDMLFRYSITTQKGNQKQTRPRNFGWAVCNPLMPVQIHGKQDGDLENRASFCQLDKPNAFLLTLKRAEDGDGIIARIIETEGKRTATTLTLPYMTIKSVYRTNIVEENQNELPLIDNAIKVPLDAFGITTIRIKTS